MPYQQALYSFQDGPRSAAAISGMDAMEQDGWSIHTAIPNYNELSVLWFKPLEQEKAPEHCPGCMCGEVRGTTEPAPE